MSPGRHAARRFRSARAVIALAATATCVGAALAYAAARHGGAQLGLGEQHAVQQPSASGPGSPANPGGKGGTPPREKLLRPQLIETPAETTVASDPQFRFNVPPRKPPVSPPPPAGQPNQPAPGSTRRFQCRVDGADWSDCGSPYRLSGLAPGFHHFAVRVFNREERVGEASGFDWRQTTAEARVAAPPARNEAIEPMPFSIVALEDPEDLYPGLAPTPIPVRITNPNDVAIEVTAISVAIGEAPASCPAANFELIPAGASPENPVVVPASGSVDLPRTGAAAPAIRMVDLPVEQDACRGSEIPLVFNGEAHG